MVIEFSNLIFFGLIFCYLAMAILIDYIKNTQINYKIEFINICLFLSILFIVSLTLFPIRFGYKFEGFEIYNLVPLRIIIKMFNEYPFGQFLYNVVANIVLFIPFGFFIYIKNEKNIKKSLIIIFSMTLGVEII